MNYESSFSRDETARVDAQGNTVRAERRLWPVLLGVVAIAAIIAAAYFAFSKKSGLDAPAGVKASTAKTATGTGKDKEAPNVTVIVPGRSTVPNIVNATGTLAARRDLPIGAVGEGGLVTRVLVEPGQWVQAGQILAIVDRQVQSQQTNQIMAQIRVAESDVRLAENELSRARALLSRGFVSRADIDRKTAQRDGAIARLGVARAQYGENAARIRRLDIRAPSSGLILARHVEAGQVVGAGGAVLFRIADQGAFELLAQMSETDLVRMGVGYRASVVPVGSERTFPGQVHQISPIIDPQTRQGTVRIALPYDRALRPGGFASVKIDSGSVEAPLLPESAVQSDSKGNYVYVLGADNKVERRDVTVGSVNDQGVSILVGLEGTETVVMSAAGFLNPGEKVIPKLMVPPTK
jgi:HlyD family secretion protein